MQRRFFTRFRNEPNVLSPLAPPTAPEGGAPGQDPDVGDLPPH